jgi:hypothetical protein
MKSINNHYITYLYIEINRRDYKSLMKAKNKNSNQNPLYQSSLHIGDTQEQKSEDGS